MAKDVVIDFAGELSELKQSLTGMESYIKGWGSTVAGIGVGAFAAWAGHEVLDGLKSITSELMECAEAAREVEQIQAKLEAVIKSTGGAAGFTADELGDMASRLKDIVNVDDDVIKSAQTVLLTFKEIKGDTFTRTTQAALDMSAVLGGDLSSAAMQLGKALNDPERGMNMLAKAGVTFTDSQKAAVAQMIKLGDVAGAQNLILAEMEAQFGGAAKAAANAAGGGFAHAMLVLDDIKEDIGKELLPLLDELAPAFEFIATEIGDAIKDLIGGFDELGESITDSLDAKGAGEALIVTVAEIGHAIKKAYLEGEIFATKLARLDEIIKHPISEFTDLRYSELELKLKELQEDAAAMGTAEQAGAAALDRFRDHMKDVEEDRKTTESNLAAAKPSKPNAPSSQQAISDLSRGMQILVDKVLGRPTTAKEGLESLKDFFGGAANGVEFLAGAIGKGFEGVFDQVGDAFKPKKEDFQASFEDLGSLFNRIQASSASDAQSPEAKAAEKAAIASEKGATASEKVAELQVSANKLLGDIKESVVGGITAVLG